MPRPRGVGGRGRATSGCQSSATGVYLGVGPEHRYVAYGTGVLVVAGGILVAIVAAGLGAVH